MKKAIPVYILDTSAVIAFIENEDGADTIEELLNQKAGTNGFIAYLTSRFNGSYGNNSQQD